MLKDIVMYFDFDDEVLASEGSIETAELMKELHSAYGDIKTILFDEIQNLPAWELFVNRLHREGYNLILTGSNAHLLSKELATHLTGRHMPIELLPFDFKEFLKGKKFEIDPEYKSLPEKHGQLLNLLDQYLLKGGFPEVVVFYYKTRNDREIDFVVKKGTEVTELIQVCYESINPDVEQRETKALVEASADFETTVRGLNTEFEKLTDDAHDLEKKIGDNFKKLVI